MNMKISLCAAGVAAALSLSPVAANAQFSSFFGRSNDTAAAEKSKAQVEELVASKPAKLKPFYRALFLEGERNAVLNFNHLALAALELGEYDTAKRALDQAIARIDSIYASDENAKKAKSVWAEEKIKDWKGEPYERAMTYYYRGLLYLKDGEYDNAAAAFRAADYQDTQAAAEEYQGDFGLMPYLAAWAQSCRGSASSAKDLYDQAVAKDKSVADLPFDAKFLAIVDSGIGPLKTARGKHNEVLTFADAAGGLDNSLKIFADVASFTVSEPRIAGDVQFQATTRGGRAIDGILNGKAQWKSDTQAAGDAAVQVGLTAMTIGAYSGNSDMAGAGAIIGLLGLIAKSASDAMTPAADTRYWGALPRHVYVATAGSLPGDAKLSLSYDPGSGATETKPFAFVAKNQECGIAWGRTRSALAASDGGTAAVAASPAFDDAGRQSQNSVLRTMLLTGF